MDYRKLNSVTHHDAYPLPRIDSTLDALAGSRYFTTLDLASGYWQVALKEEDKEKTAFSTRQGHFEFNVMPFGLTNAPATFQRLMECVLAGLNMDECLIYLDDIIVFGHSVEEHLKRLDKVLGRIRDAGLKLRAKKCNFVQEKVRYLGHIVSANGIQQDDSMIQAVAHYPIPADAKQLRHFLGLSNYYRKFVKDYSKIAEPLHKLLRKDSRFSWNTEAHQAFEELKQSLISPPILAFPDFKQDFILYTDASESALGAVLSQTQDNQERVIAYWSRQLTKAERNYSTIEREALAIVSAIKEFYPYLYGFRFTLVTDHNPLTSLKGIKDIGGRLNRWLLFLQQFQYTIVYKPGKQHTYADSLSRIPQPVHIVQDILPSLSSDNLSSAQLADYQLKPVIAALKDGEPLPTQTPPGLKRAYLCNGILCRQYTECASKVTHTQLVIPSSLQKLVCHQIHNCNGHLGIHKTTSMIRERFYWPGYEDYIQNFVKSCPQCQRRAQPQPQPCAPLVCKLSI